MAACHRLASGEAASPTTISTARRFSSGSVLPFPFPAIVEWVAIALNLQLAMRMGKVDRAAVALCMGALLYVVTGFYFRLAQTIQPAPIPLVNSDEPVLSGNSFAIDAVPDLRRPEYVTGPLAWYGSFLEHGDSMGSVSSASFKAVSDFYILVSGFPNRPGNHLLIEVRKQNAEVVRVPISPFADPARRWLLIRASLRPIAGAKSFRILATDANKGPEGWLGFSVPFADANAYGRHAMRIPTQLLEILLAADTAFVALLAPGFLLRQIWFARTGRLFSLIWVAVPGLLGLALLGTAAWLTLPQFDPAKICRFVLAIFFVLTACTFLRIRFSNLVTKVELRVLLVGLGLAAICIAKSIYSLGPVGELYHDQIARTLEIGGRSDSKLPYHVAQLVGLRQGPNSPLARTLYATWTFSDRGQLVALAAVPLILAGPTQVLNHQPSDVWTIFDPQGFGAYRVSMIVFAACSLLFVYGICQHFLPEDWSLFAVLVTATAPFFVHETYFTWPKLEMAAFVLLAGYLALRARFLLSGLALGLAYMCHPAALFSAPALIGVIVLVGSRAGVMDRRFSKRAFQLATATILLFVGLGIWMVFWRVVNGSQYSQGVFLSFAAASGKLPATPVNWLTYRVESLLNTFVPLNQFLFHSTDTSVNSIEGPSPPVVRFFVQPWSAVPFATGLGFFFCLLPLVYVGFKKARSWAIFVLAVPLIIFTGYMGVDSSGLLKDGLHAWFLSLLIFSIVVWKKYGTGSQVFWRICNWALVSRAADLLLMMLLPVIWTQHSIVRPPFVLTDILALCAMIAGTAWLCVWTFRLGEALRVSDRSDGVDAGRLHCRILSDAGCPELS